MPTSTIAAVVHRPGGPFELENVEIDDPRPDEILVRIVTCGLCHTDLAARDGAFGAHFPAVFGHEGAGIVERVGKGVDRVKPGDKVLISFSSCGKCSECRRGRPSQCHEFDELNFGEEGTRQDGSATILDSAGNPIGGCFFGQSSLARHALTRERSIIPVETTSEDQLALLAPFGCGIQAGAGTVSNELMPRHGQSLAVFGAGTVGLAALMAARIAGASPIVAVDKVPSRLQLALELGADFVINSRTEDVGKRIAEIAGKIDYAVETTGVSRIIDWAVRSLAPRGKLSMLAVSADEGSERITPKSPDPGQTVIYSIAGDSVPQKFIPFLIECFRGGQFPLGRLIREYPASEINRAVADSLAGITIKPVIRF